MGSGGFDWSRGDDQQFVFYVALLPVYHLITTISRATVSGSNLLREIHKTAGLVT